MLQRSSKMPQDASKMLPKMLPRCPKMLPRSFEMLPSCPKIPQDMPRYIQDHSQAHASTHRKETALPVPRRVRFIKVGVSSRRDAHFRKNSLYDLQHASRCFKMAPRCPQDAPKMPQVSRFVLILTPYKLSKTLKNF